MSARASCDRRSQSNVQPVGMIDTYGSLRVPGQAVLRPLRHPGLAGRRGRHGRRGGRRRPTGSAIRSSSRPRCRSAGAARRAASSSPPTPTRSARTPATSSAWTSRATSSSVVWIEHASDIAEEYYASFTLDRGAKQAPRHALGARAASRSSRSPTRTPTRSPDLHIDPVDGLTEARCRAWVEAAKLNPEAHRRRGRHPA